ncbi:helix-turn-helix domain-containing protein [Anaeromicropila herbilytica]|uniref:HTH araC/xylS-type domain-containing protein n=1 Tax=Anaeromicropila herbilytica TaxID=2785025 RepID=A0A7R7EJ50_9FIRM|nr:AraC family transcriptional regulator [Anaeromicropila herbilytica]BCN29713.1 hypothetical protein bsdtb5_10080 [Anaeromicropila herbilytica]
MLSEVYVEKIEDYISENYNKQISLVHLANYVGFSSYYLSKLMKEAFDINYCEYLTKIRVEKAKDLLQEREFTISEISYKVGYSEPKYFSNVFRKMEGISPSEYRKRFIKELA